MTSSSSAELSPLQVLENRLRLAEEELDQITEVWNRISNGRLVLALIAILPIYWSLRTSNWVWGSVSLLLGGAFVGLLIWHQRVGASRRQVIAKREIRVQGIARVNRDWSALPVPPVTNLSAEHPYANDLDLTGRGSLLQLIDTTQTPSGIEALIRWLAGGSNLDETLARQTVARRLVEHTEWRESLPVSGLVAGKAVGNPDIVIDWIENHSGKRVGAFHVVAVVSGIMAVATTLLVLAGQLSAITVLPFLLVNTLIRYLIPGPRDLSEINRHNRALAQYRAVLPIAESVPGGDQLIVNLRNRLTAAGRPASLQLSRLDRVLALVIPREMIIWFPLQIWLNWDFLVDGLLRHVANQFGRDVRGWIETVGEIEALAALSGVAALNPTWTWPTLDTENRTFDGSDLGHPLITADRMVANDVVVGPAGSVLIVTGSNMAGKSTLLRTIGLNAVLARAGGPVCASRLVVPMLPIWSSVRIQDSLEQGISLYMAELLRLKQIVDAAREGPVIYLLDEILHGTNTTERQIAARSVIRQLISLRSIGAVSTHDLELVDEELGRSANLVHLVDQINDTKDGPIMTFDYKVKPGLAPSSNALKLLRLVGMGDLETN